MLNRYTASILCNGDGAATVYLGSCIRGYLVAVQYTKGTLDAGTDIVVTTETTGLAILTDSPAASETFYPRAFATQVSDGAAEADAAELIPVYQERIKVVVAQGGAAGAGSIAVIVDEEV